MIGHGAVRFFDGQRDSGFITPDDGAEEVFFHCSAIEAQADHRTVSTGQAVTFLAERAPGGLRETRVEAVV